MSARKTMMPVSVVAIALALAAIAPSAPAEAGSAPSAAAAGVDPAQQAINDDVAHVELASDIEKRVADARAEFGKDVPLRVESGLFVIYAAERGVPFDAAADFTQRTLDVYLGSFFARRPDRAVSVELVRSTSALAKRCDARFPSRCEGALGAYSRKSRVVLVNVAPGLPTISHELIHPLVQTDFPRIPAWFDEGIGALFEKPVFDPPGEMHGQDNWRYERLVPTVRRFEQSNAHLLPLLFDFGNEFLDRADERDETYGEARALCQWLDERGQLWPFYRAWRDGVAEDPYGRKSFAQVTGMTPEQADATWLVWAKARRWR